MMQTLESQYFIGCDVASLRDFTAVAVLRKDFSINIRHVSELLDIRFYLVHYERLERMEYPQTIQAIKNIATSPELSGAKVVVDSSGVGKPVYDELKRSVPSVVGITITGGSDVTTDEKNSVLRVPKLDLITKLLLLFQKGLLKIAQDLPAAQQLRNELLNYRYEISKATGRIRFNAGDEAVHDDLLMSLALASWYGSRGDDNKTFKSYIGVDAEPVPEWDPLRDGL